MSSHFLVVLKTQDSWVQDETDCDFLEKEVGIFTHLGKGYMLMKWVKLFAAIFPIWELEWLH